MEKERERHGVVGGFLKGVGRAFLRLAHTLVGAKLCCWIRWWRRG
jgi:hypothetical protein